MQKMKIYQRQDPWEDSIDKVILDLKDSLRNFFPIQNDPKPFSTWIQEQLYVAMSRNPNFTASCADPLDKMIGRDDWYDLCKNQTDWQDEHFTEKGIILRVSFERLAGYSIPGAFTHRQYLGFFIYERKLSPVSLLSIKRKLPNPFIDPVELCFRYSLPSLKSVFDFVRSRTGRLEQALRKRN